MFYYLSKLVWLVIQPSVAFFLMIVIGLLLANAGYSLGGLRTRAKVGRFLVGLGLVAYFVMAFTPAYRLLLLPLENRFERPEQINLSGGAFAGMILLGGGVDTILYDSRGTIEFNASGDRVQEALLLARENPSMKLLISGGGNAFIERTTAESILIAEFAKRLGVSSDQLLIESRSRNTAENAKFSYQLVGEASAKKWLLITSAFHMPRSIGIYRQVGFDVVAWPVDYRATREFRYTTSASENLLLFDLAVREWIGLIAYYVTGKSKSLFPTPA